MAERILRPHDLGELLLRIEDRLRRLENRNRAVIGSGTSAYVLEVDDAGQLTARHATTGTVTVLATP